LLRNPIFRMLVLAGVCLLAIAPFLWKGSPSGHDFEFHMYSWMDVLSQWKHGIAYPRWAGLAHWGYGEPRFVFYPPASWMLGAALGAALPWKVVPAAYCWIVLSLAGAFMYRLGREWLEPRDALFAALFYALNPYHLLIVYWRSAYAELLAAVLLPAVLLYFWQIYKSQSTLDLSGGRLAKSEVRKSHTLLRSTMFLSMTLAAAWLTNLPAALMIHYSIAGLALIFAIRSAAQGRSSTSEVWRPLLGTAAAIVLGTGLASFYLLPAIYEQRWINVDQVLSLGVRPQDNFLFTKLADVDHNRFNLLVSVAALAEIVVLIFAIVNSRRRRTEGPVAALAGSISGDAGTLGTRPWTLLTGWGTASAVVMFSITNLLWQHLPKFRFVQLPFRWLLCMNAALAVLLAMATKHWISRLLICAALVATLMIAGRLTQPPWWDTAADIREMGDFMATGAGYEGTDEYVPVGADASELNKSLPVVSDDSGAPVENRMSLWGPTKKHFSVRTVAAQNVVIRLFNYPAWEAVVNGKKVATEKTETTGLMVIPVGAGQNDIYLYFKRTTGRMIGDVVSLISLASLLLGWMKLHTSLRVPQTVVVNQKDGV